MTPRKLLARLSSAGRRCSHQTTASCRNHQAEHHRSRYDQPAGITTRLIVCRAKCWVGIEEDDGQQDQKRHRLLRHPMPEDHDCCCIYYGTANQHRQHQCQCVAESSPTWIPRHDV